MMEQPTQMIAIVTTNPDSITGGGVPIFMAKNSELLQETSLSLEKILDASAHEVDEQTMILVTH